jgi:copper chaperone NosL
MRNALCLLFVIVACGRTGSGPVAIVYDKEACAHCHMLIGDPRYAAQLVTEAGDVVDFDDPGCLLRYVATVHPHVRAIWFRDAHADRWLSAEATRFVADPATPMGWGLAAVDARTPGAQTLEQATAQIARADRSAR